MTELTTEEMRLQASQLSTDDLQSYLASLQGNYDAKRISLGHCVQQKEEDRLYLDMLSDNAFYMILYKELLARHQREAEEAWRKFDHDSEAYIEKIISYIRETYGYTI